MLAVFHGFNCVGASILESVMTASFCFPSLLPATGGNRMPTQFMCLVLKMLQIQPEKEIIIEFILNDDYKYVHLSLTLSFWSLAEVYSHKPFMLQVCTRIGGLLPAPDRETKRNISVFRAASE